MARSIVASTTFSKSAGGCRPAASDNKTRSTTKNTVPKSDQPEDGFTIYVHPYFLARPEMIPYLVLYQLVLVNYGEFATAEDAEVFGASALGLSQEEYYSTLCQLADELSPEGNPPV